MSIATGFARGLSYGDLPQDVRAMARRCLLDLAGCAVAGAATRKTPTFIEVRQDAPFLA